jgi:hypothetical protein
VAASTAWLPYEERNVFSESSKIATVTSSFRGRRSHARDNGVVIQRQAKPQMARLHPSHPLRLWRVRVPTADSLSPPPPESPLETPTATPEISPSPTNENSARDQTPESGAGPTEGARQQGRIYLRKEWKRSATKDTRINQVPDKRQLVRRGDSLPHRWKGKNNLLT